MKCVAYYRVSTRKQGNSGLGLEAQKQAVAAIIDAPLLAEFTEVESGRNNDRPQLKAAMDYASLTGATLLVAKLDRLSRNAAFLNSLIDSHVPIRFADMPFADRFMIGIMAQVAQWEAEQISKRTKEALAAAKAKGAKLGGDRGNIAAIGALGRIASADKRTKATAARAALVKPHIDAARAEGCVSLRDIAAYLNARHITTAQGGQWYAASVKRLIGLN
ncbi:recombinase family protein [Sphingobium sp. WTD-1]|uniref:recombinase family protein n=1 Tax=Sphingobium sp. WTD-1 TaxID=2979467 RepID=UPI0024DE5A67|nr:recombinase family protein [Sphingobium sp. WTD-1]WIA55050.1 recombinase family protein [Sphingobium sp. WTD-1]